MSILNLIRRPEAVEPQKPGRHSTVGLVDRLTRELAELRNAHTMKVQEAAKFQAWFHKADAGWRAADAEVQRLRRLLDQDAQVPATAPQPAFVDRPDFQPLPDAPEPERDQEQLPPIALTLPRPETYNVADVNAETQPVPQVALDATQAVDVTTLREAMGMGRTAVVPVVAVAPPTQIPAGPGSADPTEVSSTTARRAVISGAAAISQGATQ